MYHHHRYREKEEEPPRGLKEQQGEERGGNFVVVGAPTRKSDFGRHRKIVSKRCAKIHDELYADPNSNIHLLPNSTGSAINSGGGLTAEKRGESNNTRSPSRQQAKAPKAAAVAKARCRNTSCNFKRKVPRKTTTIPVRRKKKSTTATAATNTEMKIAESTHTSQESDERRADVVKSTTNFLSAFFTEEEKKKKGKSFSTGRLTTKGKSHRKGNGDYAYATDVEATRFEQLFWKRQRVTV